MGSAFEALAKPTEAADSFRKALQIDSRQPEAHLRLALNLKTMGKSAEACLTLEAAAHEVMEADETASMARTEQHLRTDCPNSRAIRPLERAIVAQLEPRVQAYMHAASGG